MKRIISYFFINILIITNSFLLPVKSNENTEEVTISEEVMFKGSASINDVLKKNTKLKISLNKDINALENQVGDEFSATILNDLNINDINLIPVGSTLVGRIEGIMHSGKASMQGTVEISLNKILLPSGKYIPLNGARLAANSTYTNMKHNIKGEGNGLAKGAGLGALKGASLTFIPGNKVVKTGAIGVAATGAVFSGGWSLTSTAVIGGLTGLAYGLKKHGSEVMLASGQELEIELDGAQDLTPVELTVEDIMNQGVQTSNSTETVIK